jgi:hypothetical protein
MKLTTRLARLTAAFGRLFVTFGQSLIPLSLVVPPPLFRESDVEPAPEAAPGPSQVPPPERVEDRHGQALVDHELAELEREL